MENCALAYDWKHFLEKDFEKMQEEPQENCVGCVRIGDISIKMVCHSCLKLILFDYYVLHEVGYGKTSVNNIPYDFADGNGMYLKNIEDMNYAEFKKEAEKLFNDYIFNYKGEYSLLEHARQPLGNWN